MKKYILLFLLIPTLAHAEMFVCFDDTGNFNRKTAGDCMKLGLCSDYNNQGLDPDCIIATKEEYDKAAKFTEKDGNAVVGSRVKDMEQAEIDAILQAEADAQKAAQIERAERLDFTMQDVIVALVKRINARIPNNPILKQEIIDQLKADKGLD